MSTVAELPCRLSLAESTQIHRSSAPMHQSVWTFFAVCAGGLILASVVSGVVLTTAAVGSQGPQVLTGTDQFLDWFARFAQTRLGLVVLLLPSQLVLLLAAWGAGLTSQGRLLDSLRLRSGRLPIRTWWVFLLATPVVSLATSQALSIFPRELSPTLVALETGFRVQAHQSFWLLLVLAALVPALGEELLFRGYLQTRLTERWPAGWAILASALMFSAMHLSPLHALSVLPLSLWLGLVAWRAGSIWPAILGHAANNTLATLGMRFRSPGELGLQFDALTFGILIVGVPAFFISLCWLRPISKGPAAA